MSKASLRRRTTAALSSALAVVLGLTLGIAAAAPATADTQPVDPTDPRTPVTAAADDLPTVQIDGVVWSQVTVGTTVYAGGSFQNARPAGAAPGTNLTPRHNLLAYDITTGKLITSFNHDFNGQVLGVTKSPDGSRLYVTGDFTQVDGQWRVRVAAFDTATGALVAGFRPTLASRGYAVAATNDTVYVGGNFTSVASQTGGTLVPSPFLAAFDATTGAIKSGFAGTADAPVLALTVPPAQQMVVVGGRFATLSGQAIRGLGAVDPATGAAISFPTNQFIWASGADAAVLSLTSDSQGIYGSAYHFGDGGNLEGPFRADPVTGELIWVADCHGDTYSTYRMGDALYTASHQHYCGNIPDGFPQTDPWTFHFGTAFSMQPTGVNTPDIYGYPDHPGQPAPSVLTWYPLLYTGTFTGQGQAGWSVTGAGGYLSYGGEFVAVNTSKQQGLVRFATREIAPNKLGPRLRDAAINPTLLSLSGGTMRVSWPQNWDRDNETLTYKVYRATQNAAPVFTKTVTQKEWQRTTMGFVDTGLTPGSSVRYRLTVSDPYNNTVQSEWVTGTVASGGGAGGAYSQAVLGDGAGTYWRLGEAGGTASAYDWAGFNDGVVGTGVTRGASGAVGDADAASTFDGSTNGLVATQTKIQGPDLFTVEAWIRTTSTAGGKIIGFGNANTGTSSSYDRHVYMEPDGRLTFGVWTGQAVTVSSAPGYNDGQWHHVVASLGPNGERLYVDGVRVGSRSDVSAGQSYQGYWRVGGDSSWAGANFFAGDIDDVAIYPTVLSYQQVVGHWTAAGRTSALPPVPADAYGAAVQQLGPDLYWRLDETSGTAAADTGWSASPGTYRSGTTLGKPGAFGSGTAVQFDGASGLLSSNRSYDNPTQYSEELWFSTTTTAGGKLIGFGRSATGLSSSYDRHVYMESDGRLTFGTWTGQMNTTTSTASYNDGTWHHLVATQSADGMKLYVDGALVGTNPQTGAEGYTGYWRVGGDNNWGPGQYFAGTIDEVAVYPFALSAGQVAQHYTLGAGPVNVAPTAAMTASSSALTAHVDGSGSSDPDGTIADWAWDFGDSSPATHGATADHTYATPGTYTVTLTVTDDGGKTATATAVVTATAPVNQAPTAVIGSTVTDLDVAFSAAGSADADGTIASYAWTFGDGATSTQANPSHTYAVAGTYPVTLTVTDDGGATGTANTSVTVTAPAPVNQAPTASATLTPTGLVVAANGTASSDPDGTVVGWSWAFGDGTPAVTGSTASHTYAAAGSYTVTLTVTDDKGATGTTTVPVTVVAPNQLPTASFTTSVANLAVSVDGTASSDPDGTIASYAWTFGDGGTGTGASATHTYAAAGTYAVTLTVTDDRGGQASTQHSVTVAAANQPPVVDLTANAAGLVVSFTSSASDPDGTIASYAWTFGDGGTSTAVNPSHTYAAAGTYPVTLTVTDNQGATAQVSRTVTVTSPGTPTVVASDAFARTVASGWGAADVGGTWSLSGGNAGFQVTGGVGVQSVSAGITRTARLGFATTDADLTVSVSVDKAQTGGGTYVVISPRRVGSSEYQGRLRFLSSGVVSLAILRDGASLGTVDLPGTYTPGTALAVRLQATGTSPTALRLKVWRAGQAEPAAWQVSATDSTAALQAPGGIGISSYLSGSATNGPVAVSYDDLKVASAGAQPPVNQPPAAAFTASTSARTVSVDGSGSTDPEGAALGYAWDFGDGTGASGVTAAHTYAADGAYTVRLTVTDAGGLTATTTRSVTVAAPVGAELGTDTFTRTVATGWGSANVGGPWSLTGTASAFKVDAGAGLQVTQAGATLTGYLPGVSASGVDVAVRVSADQAATGGGTSLVVIGRRVGTSTYAGRVKLLAGGAVQVQALRDSTTLASANLAGTYTPGTQLQVRLRVVGTSPTTIQAKVWPVGQPEPTAWQVSTTDTTAALQAAGSVGLLSYVSGSATTVPVTVRWDELHVTAP